MNTEFAYTSRRSETVAIDDARAPLVLALDIGSTSVRGCVFDSRGRAVVGSSLEHKHAFETAPDGTSQIDPEILLAECAANIEGALGRLNGRRVDAVVMDTFASSFICVDEGGEPLTACITYADARSADSLTDMLERVDEDDLHNLTGARLHTSYHAPKFAWLRATAPEILERTRWVESIGTFIWRRLTDVRVESMAGAAWSGMLNRKTGDYAEEMLDLAGVPAGWFAPLLDPSESFTAEQGSRASSWPQLAGARWFAPVPDGFASNWGVGAVDGVSMAMSAATSGAMRILVSSFPEQLPRGLWAYRVSRDHTLLGGALNDVGRIFTWLEEVFAVVDRDELRATFAAEPVEGTPLMLPFLTGERSTGWAGRAVAQINGLTAATGPLDVWRGAAESLALSYLRILEEFRRAGVDPRRVLASGGVIRHYGDVSPVLADCLGLRIVPATGERITMRGAALMALESLNPSAAEGSEAIPIPTGTAVSPRAEHSDYYRRRLGEFEEAYRLRYGG